MKREQKFMELKQEVVDRFNAIFKRKKSSKLKKSDLLKEQEDLLHEIEIQKEMIQHLKNALAKAHDELESNRQKYYEEGIKYGRYLSNMEEVGVLEELKILQEITATLENDRKDLHQK